MTVPVGDDCLWSVRDLDTWRTGLLSTASADLLVAVHGTNFDRARDVDVEAIINEIRAARQHRDFAALEAARTRLVDLVDDGPVRHGTAGRLKKAAVDLKGALAEASNPKPCLLGCATPAGCVADERATSPAADHGDHGLFEEMELA